MNIIKVKCYNCGNTFERRKSDVDYRKKHGMKIYCGLQCAGKRNSSQLKPYQYQEGHAATNTTPEDELLSPFRAFLRRAKLNAKERKKECTISLHDIVEQWDKQKGICPYTGWGMDNPAHDRGNNRGNLTTHPKQASLDRINSSKGYIKGNIQFVTLMAQYAKNKFKESELLEFCEAVVQNKKAMLP